MDKNSLCSSCSVWDADIFPIGSCLLTTFVTFNKRQFKKIETISVKENCLLFQLITIEFFEEEYLILISSI